jgi:acyl carrier protein
VSDGSETLRSRLKQILVQRLKLDRAAETIGDDEPLFDPAGLGLDSIDALEFVLGIEQELGVQVGDAEVAGEALATIDHLARFLTEKNPELDVPVG